MLPCVLSCLLKLETFAFIQFQGRQLLSCNFNFLLFDRVAQSLVSFARHCSLALKTKDWWGTDYEFEMCGIFRINFVFFWYQIQIKLIRSAQNIKICYCWGLANWGLVSCTVSHSVTEWVVWLSVPPACALSCLWLCSELNNTILLHLLLFN